MPAIYNLVNEGLLDEDFAILGVNRGDDNEGAFAQGARSSLDDRDHRGRPRRGGQGTRSTRRPKAWLQSRVFHLKGDITDSTGCSSGLGKKIDELTKDKGHRNVVFYLATAPEFFGAAVEGLGKAGLTKEGEDQFRRIIIEKPFGTDLKSARALDEQILGVVEERPDLPHRPFPRQGDGAEHHGAAVRELHVRADLEPRPHRSRADHRRRDRGRGNPRKVLRQDRRAARHGAQPHVPAAGDDDDGGAELVRRRRDPR